MTTIQTSSLASIRIPVVRAFRRIGLVTSFAWLLGSAACSSAQGGADPGTGGAADTTEGGVPTGTDGGTAHDSGVPMVMGGGDGGHAKDAAAPPGCDLTKDPKDSLPCIVDGFGVFVDATSGSDANDGTKAHPLAHVQAGLAKGLPRVYVCAGTYAEHVKITAGVGVFGGFACTDFSYDAANVVTIAPADAGYAVEIADVADGVLVEDITMSAQPATAALPTSVAAFAHGSASVTMKRAIAIAADGYAGASSTVGSNYDLAQAPSGNAGSSAGSAAVAGLPPTCVCASGVSSTPGKGFGIPLVPAIAPSPGAPAIAGIPGGAAGAGTCSAGGVGQNGANGVSGSDAPAPTSLGSLTAQGWLASGGGGGTMGGTAQGGGGGSGFSGGGLSGAGGGSGACGGCGGAPASATTGGGGSIALLVWESGVNLLASSLVAATGGDGGGGSPGQVGEGGGTGGAGSSTGGCSGGSGGGGGNGGASAGGAGGVSVGLLYLARTVKAPAVDAATLNAIATGTAGQRGVGGLPGKDGIALSARKMQDASNL